MIDKMKNLESVSMTDEEILYDFYLKSAIKSREEAISLLNNRDFSALSRDYNHWYEKQEKVVDLESNSISEVIKELSNVKFEQNESEPTLYTLVEENESMFGDTDTKIVLLSYLYTIISFEKCESSAKHYTKSALWKLKHQSNGKDAKRYQEIIANYKNQSK